jgi:hypothetical protein
MKKRIFAVLLTAVLLALPSCTKNTPPSYRSDKTAVEVYSAVAEVVSTDAPLAAVDTDYVRYRMMLDTSIMEDYAIYMQNTGSSLDEIGIIKAIGNDTAAVEKAVQDYLTQRNEEWTGMYLVEEYPKLRDAEYRIFGQYVVYGILSEAEKTALFDAVSASLSDK